MTDIHVINHVEQHFFNSMLSLCSKSKSWVNLLTARRPFSSIDEFLKQSKDIWMSLPRHEWLSVINQEPLIGDTHSEQRKNSGWSDEHTGVSSSSSETLAQLKVANHQYDKQFGFRYIVCASGKSGDELLEILQTRLSNSPEQEIHIAASELAKIIELRLINSLQKSPVTTHVLDTCVGKPAANIRVSLSEMQKKDWKEIAQSVTNQEGRAITFIPSVILKSTAQYKMAFEIEGCFFSPIQNSFRTRSVNEHYHLPLLVSPFGYTIYRGS